MKQSKIYSIVKIGCLLGSIMEHLWIIIGIPENKWFEFSLSSVFLCGSANCVICIPGKVNTYISRHLEFILKKSLST